MIAVRILGFDPKEVRTRTREREHRPCSDSALGLEIQAELSLGHDSVIEVGPRALARFFLTNDEVADYHALLFSVRIVVREHELKHQRLAGLGWEARARLIAASGRLSVGAGTGLVNGLAGLLVRTDDPQVDGGMLSRLPERPDLRYMEPDRIQAFGR